MTTNTRIETRAALLVRPGSPLEVRTLELEAPRGGEVLVEVGATGICQSDLSVIDGSLPGPAPMVIGHEGAGTVVALGAGVTGVAPGDRVVLSWLPQCGTCFYCSHRQPALCASGMTGMARGTLPDGTTRLRWGDQPVFQMAGLGTFAQRVVVPQAAVVRVPDSVPLPQAALIGCGVLTGFGAAVNSARVQRGESVVVIGCGGVGLNAVQGARIAGAGRIIAVDPREDRRSLARLVGATDVLLPGKELVAAVRDLTGGRGADVSIEVAGLQETIDTAIRLARPGGRVVIVSAPGPEVRLSVPVFTGLVLTEKTIKGSLYGSSHVRSDVGRLVDLYRAGDLLLDELVARTFVLDEINEAINHCNTASGARAVVVFEEQS